MGYRNAAQFDTLRTAAFGSITNSYVQLGPSLSIPAVELVFKNSTDAVIYVSTDGITDMKEYPPGWGEAVDVRTNAPESSDLLFPVGTSFFIQYVGSAPTSGSFSIEVLQQIVS